MKSKWQEFSLGLIMAAARSTAGGIVTLIVALCLGTQMGYLALNKDYGLPDCPEDWLVCFFSFFGPISLACIQLWGFLYVVFIAWVGHLLIQQEAPRLRTGALLVFPQFLCTVIVGHVLDEHSNKATVLRLLIATPVAASLSAMPLALYGLRRIRSRASLPGSLSGQTDRLSKANEKQRP